MSLLCPPEAEEIPHPLSDRPRAYDMSGFDPPESSARSSVPQVDSFDDSFPRFQPPFNENARHPHLAPFHTRLFRILRTSPKLDVESRAFNIDELPSYVAISHRWGQESASKTMSCNENLLIVKPSLVECILDVSIFTQIEWFWLDAICINQNDEKEKAIQVSLLWKLFGDAEIVLVYLGEADWYTKIAAAAIRECAERRLTQIPDTKLRAITTIWQKTWFSRLWTMQEAVLARNILFVCGTYTISFDHLKYVHQLNAAHGVSSVDAIISLRNWRQHNGEADARYCARILYLMVDQNCYLPVDRVFAVLGLFPQEIMSKVEVNYSRERCREYWTTYEQFTQALSEFFSGREGSVNKELQRLAQATSSIPQLPPWCPNFNAPNYHNGLFQSNEISPSPGLGEWALQSPTHIKRSDLQEASGLRSPQTCSSSIGPRLGRDEENIAKRSRKKGKRPVSRGKVELRPTKSDYNKTETSTRKREEQGVITGRRGTLYDSL